MCEAPGTPCTFAGYSFVGRSCSQYNKLEGAASSSFNLVYMLHVGSESTYKFNLLTYLLTCLLTYLLTKELLLLLLSN